MSRASKAASPRGRMKLTVMCRGIETMNKADKKRIERRRREFLKNHRRSQKELERGELKFSSSISELKRMLIE